MYVSKIYNVDFNSKIERFLILIINDMADIKTYNVTFKGYRLENDADGLPEYSGIYIAYRCKYNKDTNKVSLTELVYIGQAENLKKRILSHKSSGDLNSSCLDEETICYSYASVSLNDLNIVGNALIFAQEPSLNTQQKTEYNHEAASFVIEGACGLLKYTNFKIS